MSHSIDTRPIPSTEKERLEVLRDFEILDTAPEQVFDDITQIAAQICAAPIALVSLVDETRQWFKSKVGLSVCETPREAAFCAHTILTPKVMVIEDARRDARFQENPLVTGPPNIRFYAGAPLIAREGVNLGSLCVIDDKPRKLSLPQLRSLEALARLVVNGFEQRRIASELAESLERVRTLSDLLPMCAGCKKICIDDNYWKRVEAYLLEQLGTRFSHGLCPDCIPIYFPEKGS